ncbi:MAG: hypothetical protein C0433_04650 [Cyclobacterium sp.]|nr:hypothetical protein [Cyclobacterium sp.]
MEFNHRVLRGKGALLFFQATTYIIPHFIETGIQGVGVLTVAKNSCVPQICAERVADERRFLLRTCGVLKAEGNAKGMFSESPVCNSGFTLNGNYWSAEGTICNTFSFRQRECHHSRFAYRSAKSLIPMKHNFSECGHSLWQKK